MQDLLKENKDLQEAVLKKDAQLEAVDQEMARLREEAEARLVRLQEEHEATLARLQEEQEARLHQTLDRLRQAARASVYLNAFSLDPIKKKSLCLKRVLVTCQCSLAI